MIITLIVAVAENDVIGRDGDLPWKLSADMAFFRRTTIGHPVIMGRRTWDTLPKPLEERVNIVLTRQGDLQAEAVVVHSAEDALAACGDADECFVIGGGEVYRLFLEQASRVLLTRVHTTVDGDSTFPLLDEKGWVLESSEDHPEDDRNEHAMSFQAWRRR